PQAIDYPIATKNHHGVEQWRRYCLADDGHSRSINKQAGFYAFGFGQRSQRMVAGIMVPILRCNCSQLFREFGEQFRNFRILPAKTFRADPSFAETLRLRQAPTQARRENCGMLRAEILPCDTY